MSHLGALTKSERSGRHVGIGCLAVAIALLWSGLCAGQVINPSFEDSYPSAPVPREFPSFWRAFDNASFNSKCTDIWRTDGVLSAILYNRAGEHVFPGDFASIWQYIDLTDVSFIAFDAMLAADTGEAFGPFEASVLVTSLQGEATTLWSETVEGVYRNQLVDVSAFSGYYMLELRITATGDGTFATEFGAFWDNMAICDGPPAIAAALTLTPDPLVVGRDPKDASGSLGKWVTCFIELEGDYDPAEIDVSTVRLSGISDGDDVPAYIGQECWARPEANRANLGDIDGDGVLERMVRFDGNGVGNIVEAPETTVTVQGQLNDGTFFVGTATVQVIEKGPGVPGHMDQFRQRAFTWRFRR